MIENYDKVKVEYYSSKISSIYIYAIVGNYVYHFKNGNRFIGSAFFDFQEVFTLTRPDKLSILTSMFCLNINKEEVSGIANYHFTYEIFDKI